MRFALSCKKHFSPRAKVFVCSTINVFVIYLEGGLKGGLEHPRKRTEKVSLKLHFI